MDRTTVPEGGAKLRLVEAAEELFAVKGFDVVSVRDITKQAGMNIASVNYHFGSRDGLVAAVMSRYVAPINEERLARLEVAERRLAGKPVPLEELLDIFIRPLVNQVRRSELSERLFLKLLGRMFGERAAEMPPVLEEQTKTLVLRLSKAFAKTLPGLTLEEVIWRLHFVTGALFHAMSQEDLLHRISSGESGSPSMEVTMGRFTRFALAGLQEGLDGGEKEVSPKGPQATFDF